MRQVRPEVLNYQRSVLSHSLVSNSLWLPDPGIEPGSPALQVDSLPAELSGEPLPFYILGFVVLWLWFTWFLSLFPFQIQSKWPTQRSRTQVSHIAGGFFTISATREAPHWPHSWVIWMIGGYFSQILLCGTVVNIPVSQSNLQSPGFLVMWFCL